MKKRTSLKDIANRLGVSASLVSYALNHKLEDRINKDTAEKIRKTAAEMNYQPNQIAKSLKNNKTQTIGLIVADISNPFSSIMARIIEDEAKKNNYTVIFGSADESKKKAIDLISVLLSRQVDGFIIAAPEGLEKQLVKLQLLNVPFVLIDRYFPGLDANYISIDNFNTSFKAIKHLMDNGFKNIGMLNYKTKLFHLEERTRGYKKAIRQGGVQVLKNNLKEIDEQNLQVATRQAIDELLSKKNPADAVFFSSNNLAIEGLSFLCKLGVKIPDELGIVCFDETKAYDLFQYPITYIRQPLKEIGQTAVKLLLESVSNRVIGKEVIILDTEIIIRSSSVRPTSKRPFTKPV